MVTATVHGTPRRACRALPPVYTPGWHVRVAFLVETLEAFGMLRNRTDICVQDDWRRRCGTHHFREPPPVGRAPIGPAHVTDIGSEQKGFETALGIFESAAGILTRPSEIAPGCIFALGDRDCGTITRARPAGASCTASRRFVVTRSPAFVGMREGATPQQSESFVRRYRESQEPQGPAS
jgi:hypothetical protein